MRAALEKADYDRSAADGDSTEKHRHEIQAVSARHEKEIAAVRDDNNALSEQLEISRATFEESKTAHENDMEALKSSHEQELKQETASREQEVQGLVSNHAEELANLRRQHEAALRRSGQATGEHSRS